MSLERYLSNGIPFAAASAFYIGMKKTAEGYEPPDETGALEGTFAAPVEQVLAFMAQLVENEFKTMLAYKIYAQSLRGLAREGVAEEFDEHADNELEHAEFLLRRMSVLGGPVSIPDIPAPPAAATPEDIIPVMIRMEQEGIAKWRALHQMLGENPMRFEVEAFMAKEQHHLDELWQLLPHTAHSAINGSTGAEGEPPVPPGPAAAEGAPPAEPSAPAPEKEPKAKEASVKKAAFGERLLPGTEHYYSERMLSVLQGLPAKVYTPEGVDYTTFEGTKLAGGQMKRAFNEMMAAPGEELPPQQGGVAGSQFPGLDPKTTAFLQSEQQGQAHEEQASSAYYKQQLDQTQAQLQAAQAAQTDLQQQAESLKQQAMMSQTAITSAQQQATQATSMAMQQLTQAGDESLRKTQEAANMRMAFQQLRGSLMNLASQEPPPSALQEPPAPPGGMAATGPAQPGQPGDTAPQGPAAQAAPAAGAPGDVPPGGDTSQAPPTAPSEPSEPTGKSQGATSVTVKQGSLMNHLPGAAAGALLGGAGTAMEAHRGHDELRAHVQQLEEEPSGGFAKAMELAKNKAMLAFGEAAEQHPVKASIMGSIMGAGIGAATQPALQSIGQSARRALQ